MRRNLLTTLIMESATIAGISLGFASGARRMYEKTGRRRDLLSDDVQAERIRKAQEKRERKAKRKEQHGN